MDWLTILLFVVGVILLLAGVVAAIVAVMWFKNPNKSNVWFIAAAAVAGIAAVAGVICLIWASYRQFFSDGGLPDIMLPMKLLKAPYPNVNNPTIPFNQSDSSTFPHLTPDDFTDKSDRQIYGIYGYRFVQLNGEIVEKASNYAWNTKLYKVLDDTETKADHLGFTFEIEIPTGYPRGSNIFVELVAKYSQYDERGIVFLHNTGEGTRVGRSEAVTEVAGGVVTVEDDPALFPIGLKA